MRLARLTALEHEKLEAERLELEGQIRRYEQILGDVGEIHKLIVADLEDLKVRYRRRAAPRSSRRRARSRTSP